MKEAFVIMSGECQVLAVFMDEVTATTWVEVIKIDDDYSDARIKKLPFIKTNTAPYKVTSYHQNVILYDDGTIKYNDMQASIDWAIDMLYNIPAIKPYVRYVRAPCYNNKGGRLEVYDYNPDNVTKIIEEKIAMWKAGTWAGPEHEEIIEKY